jgi:hypothetical protein
MTILALDLWPHWQPRTPISLVALVAPDVDFRAMTPGRFWEADSPQRVVHEVLSTSGSNQAT